MLLFLSISGIFISVLLLCFHGKKFTSSIYLGMFFMLISLYGLHTYLVFYSKSVFILALLYNNTIFLYYLIGPVLYWYVRSVLTDNSRLQKKDVLHFLPMLIFLTASLPEIFSSWSSKVEIATAIIRDSDFLQNYKATVLSEIFPVAAIYLSRPMLVLIYALLSIGLFIRYLKQKSKSLVFTGQRFMTKWLSVLLGFTLILVVSYVLLMSKTFTLKDSHLFYSLNLLQILSAAGLIGLLISPFFFPAILYGLPRLPAPEFHLNPGEGPVDHLPGEAAKHNHNYESDYLCSLGKKADACMKELQPYLQPAFNLTQLSVMIHIPEHHLAYYFREEKKQSFIDFRNEWRVNHAKDLINEGKNTEMTMEAIGLLSGFSNRNAFRIAFERIEGIPPAAYAVHQVNNSHR
jgi:AraC-like DNA-binding protein